MPLKDICVEFTPAAQAHVASNVLKSHDVQRGALRGSAKAWINKEMSDPAVARIEIMAQEFFRLIIPHQGETRLLENRTTGTYHILSEEVRGYRSLPLGETAKFSNGTYTGLGQAIVGAMFLQETDLKNGNIGLDDQGRVAKIDGDWCFSEGRIGGKNYGLTPKAIAGLPYPDFYAWNWLDVVEHGALLPRSSIVNHELSNAPQFRAEVNQAMLKIALLPDSFIDRYVDSYMPSGGARFTELIKSRREELLTSALQNESFKAYLKSPEAGIQTANLIAHMNTFKANGEDLVVPLIERAKTGDEVQARLANLKEKLAAQLKEDTEALVLTIAAIDPHNKVLQVYKNNIIRKLDKYQNNPDKLTEIKINLTKKIESLLAIQAKGSELVRENKALLEQLASPKLNPNDEILQNYISKVSKELQISHLYPEKLAQIKTMLTEKLNEVLLNQLKLHLVEHQDLFLKNYINEVSIKIDQHDPKKMAEIKSGLTEKLEAVKLVCDNKLLLEKLKLHDVEQRDVYLQNYICNVSKEIQGSNLNSNILAKIKTELTQTLNAVNSPEANAVKEAAQDLRKNSHWYTRGKIAKADRIEEALRKTPLAERATVISRQEGAANLVQQALASHRHLGKGGDVYIKNNQIDLDKSAHTFKMLKDKFRNIKDEKEVPQDTKAGNITPGNDSITQPLLK